MVSRSRIRRCRRGSLGFSVWSLGGELCRWLGRAYPFVLFRGRGWFVECWQLSGRGGGAAYCRSGLGGALRAVFLPRSDRVACIGCRCRGVVFVFDLFVGLLSVARTGLRVRSRFVRACRVLRIGRGSRIWLGGDVAVGVEAESYEKLSKKLPLAPFCPHSKRGGPVRIFSCCARECRICGCLRWFVIQRRHR